MEKKCPATPKWGEGSAEGETVCWFCKEPGHIRAICSMWKEWQEANSASAAKCCCAKRERGGGSGVRERSGGSAATAVGEANRRILRLSSPKEGFLCRREGSK